MLVACAFLVAQELAQRACELTDFARRVVRVNDDAQPFVPCRDAQLRFGVGACLNGEELPATGPYGVSPFLLGGAPLGVPPPDDSDDADY